MKIETHRPRAPWNWVGWMTLPWLAGFYAEQSSGAPLTFTLRKFVSDPALIAFISSLNLAFNFIVGAISSYMSDRIWTRWGRRRPFLITGWLGAGATMLFIPLAPNLATLLPTIVLFQFFLDVAKPYQPLFHEVIPAGQRGRASMIQSMSQNLLAIVFNAVLIARFDREYGLEAFGSTFAWNGEQLTYWIGGAALIGTALFLLFAVRETPPPEGIVRERFGPGRFIRDVFGHRRWWWLYLLYVCPIFAGAGGVFLPLLVTEQLGFGKDQFGWALGVVTAVNIVVFVPLAGFIADRLPRLTVFQVGLAGQALVNLAFFFYLRSPAGQEMSLATLIAFLCANNAFVFIIYVLWGPLVYDYIPSSRFGTVSAGFSFIAGLCGFLLTNAAGLWVKGAHALFAAPGETRIDYSTIYVFQLLAAAGAVLAVRAFAHASRRGDIPRVTER